MHPFHTLPSYFFGFLLILIFHLCLGLPGSFFASGFPTKNSRAYFFLLCISTCVAYVTFLNLYPRILFCEKYTSLSSSLCSFLQPHITRLLLGPDIKKYNLYLPINPLNPELNPICYLLAVLRAHHFLNVSRIRVKLLTFRRLMSYIYIYIYIWSTHS